MKTWIVLVTAKISTTNELKIQANHVVVDPQGNLILANGSQLPDRVAIIAANEWFSVQSEK